MDKDAMNKVKIHQKRKQQREKNATEKYATDKNYICWLFTPYSVFKPRICCHQKVAPIIVGIKPKGSIKKLIKMFRKFWGGHPPTPCKNFFFLNPTAY